MSLNVGSRLGHYDVTALIGEGGMGQVYQATDTTLDRDVALKVLPDAFTADPDRLARFEREAKVLASLNHPNIGAIYGLEKSGDTRALVLELIEGPTLADRIKRGPIPLDEALPIAKQIAEALEAAHEAGVIHRDLKPANIKVRDDGTVKVLDFGLAKALDPNPTGDPSQSPTLTAAATQMGVIMGTAAYMSPEQAKGRSVDKRADIWAFGCVVYEMLTGQPAFAGGDVSTTLARVIEREPLWDQLPPTVEPSFAVFLRRCLAKEPKHRVHDIADMRLALDGAFKTAVAASNQPAAESAFAGTFRLRYVSIALAVLLLGAVAALFFRPEVSPAPSVSLRSSIAVPTDVQLLVARNNPLALSPDGGRLVYAVQGTETTQLYLRDLERFEATLIPGTEGASTPFFSPDGRWLGFVVDGTELRKVLLDEGGAPLTIARLPDRNNVAHGNFAWGADDTIVAGWILGGPPLSVSAAGGDLTPLPEFEDWREDFLYGFPQFLPGERAVLLSTTAGIELLEIDTGEHIVLVEGERGPSDGVLGDLFSPRYAPTGHLVYGQRGNLMAVPFNLEQRMVTGTPTPVLSSVYSSGRIDSHYYDFSSDGTLVYVAGQSGNRLAWVDRNGTPAPVETTEGTYRWPRISPDGAQVAVTVVSPTTGTNLWVGDRSLDRLRPLTRGTGAAGVWSPDSAELIFVGYGGIYRQDIATSGPMVLHETSNAMSRSWTSDGTVLFEQEGDIWALTQDGEQLAVVGTDADELAPTVSPNGRWMAYVSDESGQPEVWARSWPDAEVPRLLSTGGGTEPAWSWDSRELFYRADDQMLSVPVGDDGTFGQPKVLFERRYATDIGEAANYDVAPDGRFLMILTDEDSTTTQINIVQDWFEELKRLVPVD